ncbi:MAG TPA: hypothetical protein VNW06_12495 [Cytophagaceae bacterium]|jgi:hypothetical protein|nr:hypothetical protein [Cytophagaceae bacterium]
MTVKLNGKKSSKSAGCASSVLEGCKSILEKYGITFPQKFRCGTVNIELTEDFITPDWNNIIHIHGCEIHKVYPRGTFRECWDLIPIVSVNNKVINGYIYRTTTNYHGNSVVELLAEDLTKKGISTENSASFEIVLDDIVLTK